MSKEFSATVPMFDGTNWIMWEPLMKAYLKYAGVWKYVEGTADFPADPLYHHIPEEPTIREDLPVLVVSEADNITQLMVTQRNQHRAARAADVVAHTEWGTENRDVRIKNRTIGRQYDDDVEEVEQGAQKATGLLFMKIISSMHHMISDNPHRSWELF